MALALACIFGPWLLSLAIKAALNVRRDGSFSLRTSFSSGGMPSSHTTLVTAGAMTVLLRTGFSAVFLVSLVLSMIVIYDSMNMRRAIEEQLKAINVLLAGQNSDLRLHEHFGHEPGEVLAGVGLGVVGPLLLNLLFR